MSQTNVLSNKPLSKALRSQLENTVKAAREVAETAARAALSRLAVGDAKTPDYLDDEHKALRRRLRAHGRALGDVKHRDDSQGLRHLVWEVAYEHWHRMLFARFLAENGLLMWEPGASVSLDDCRDMVDHHPDMAMGAKSHWELAGKLAARMLPQVFKPQSPVFELAFAPEHQRELERLLAGLSSEVFKASDSLGWVYQFWQAKRKDEVNASEVKIGADELPAVTQLFTEPYMVDFLLHNSLGAWWVTRHPGETCLAPLTYLRTLEDGTPAAGRFEGWPDCLRDFKLLDPCCGSGHFLVAAFLMLVPMRMASEGLSVRDAVDAVLRDNLHGLEIDARCVEIAAFALALAAWRFPDENGHPLGMRADMPAPQIACCGLKVAAKPEDWMALVPNDAPNADYLRQDLRQLHASFTQAPLLGSLLDPARSLKNDLATSSFDALRDLLERALAIERPVMPWGQTGGLQDDTWDLALTARGLLDSARLLDRQYDLVVTNVPYLGRGRQTQVLRDYLEVHYPEAKNDLANVFLERCLELCRPKAGGMAQVVMPQNWLFLASFAKQRKSLLSSTRWNLLVSLGGGAEAFNCGPGNAATICLLSMSNGAAREMKPSEFDKWVVRGIDATDAGTPSEKARILEKSPLLSVNQRSLLGNPDARIHLGGSSDGPLLSVFSNSYLGLGTGDFAKFGRNFWEFDESSPFGWRKLQCSPSRAGLFEGLSHLVAWDFDKQRVRNMDRLHREQIHNQDQSGQQAWGKKGVAVSVSGDLKASLYAGHAFDKSLATIIPKDEIDTSAILEFCSSSEFVDAVRRIDKKIIVANGTLVKVPFDIVRWREIASNRHPNGLPEPYSDDPTQWLFHGYPQLATDPLQVAVARLAGYRWPAESDKSMELADEARIWIARCGQLIEHTDDDGIVCLPSVRGEPPAHERLLKLLIAAWETVQPGSWRPALLDKVLADAECAGKGLDVWLRDKFFEQHAKCFHHRPFIWHVWDGLKDGFGALVNYHKLDAKKLERLIHTYLGDWIRQQEGGVRAGIDGAQLRLAAAQDLKRRLELILEGEPPYDIFVRWKKLSEQPIGWNPDLNDGVRLNVRPFMTAEVLRHNKKPKLNITWDKDRGKDVESAPWFKVFKGERINDHHLTLAEKRAARGTA